jgi:hypothetical protein
LWAADSGKYPTTIGGNRVPASCGIIRSSSNLSAAHPFSPAAAQLQACLDSWGSKGDPAGSENMRSAERITLDLVQRSSMHVWLGNWEHTVTKKNVEIWSALCLKPPAMPLIFACRLGCEVASGWMGKKMKTRMYIRTFVCCSVPDWKSWCLGKHGVLIVPKPDVWGIVAPTKVWRMSYCWDIFWGLLAISVQLTMCGNQICLEMFGCFL